MAGSGNISKQVGGPIKADEIKWQGVQKKDDGAAAALATALGGGVTKPTPVAFPWTIYTVSSTEDDDKPGLYCLAIIDVPKDTMGLKVKGCYVKNNGAYGRVKWFPSYRLDDTERAAGRVEIQLGPFRPNSRFDIVRLVAVKRQAKDVGNPALGADDRRGKGTTPAYTPPALPAWTAPYADQIPGDGLGPLTMGTILTGDYIVGSPRVLRVSTPKTEVDGIYYPVDIGTTGGAEALMISVRFGVYRVGTKVGGANAYSKRIVIPRYELTEEDRETLIAGSALTVDVGPFKANKRYHIKWVRARYSLDPDDSGAKVVRQRHPAAVIVAGVDETQNYDANDAVDGQGNTHTKDILDATINVPGGGSETPPDNNPKPYLATLVPTGDITNPPSDPNSSDIITNEPDDATEKDKDAIIVLRVWAAEANRALYLINPVDPAMTSFEEANVNRVAVVIKTLLPDGVTYKQRRHGIDIEDPSAYFVDIAFHRQLGKSLVWVKNVSLNEADREFSSTIDLAFTAGIAGTLTGVSLTITNDGDDNRQADAAVTLTYSGGFAIPKRIVIMRSASATGSPADSAVADINNGVTGPPAWRAIFKKSLRADSEQLAVASPPVLKLPIPGVTSNAGTRYYKAYVFVTGQTNAVSSSAVSNVPAAADGITDTVAPPAPAAAPTMRHRHGHMRSKVARPSVAVDGNKTIYQYEWQFGSHVSLFTTGGGRTFLQDDDTTPITTTSSTITSTGTKLSIPIKKKDFATWQSGVTNIYCRVRAHNQSTADTYGYGAGIGEWSPVLTFAIGSAGASLDDSQAMDTVIPGACGAVKIKFKHGNLRCKTLAPSPATTDGNQNILSYSWYVSANATYTTSANHLSESGTDPEITVVSGVPTPFVTGGPTLSLPIRKHLLQTFTTVYVHVLATNNIGTSTTVATGSVAYSSLVSGVYNDDENIPLRRTFHGRRNLIIGGNCANSAAQFGSGTGTEKLGKNFFRLPTSGNIDVDANRINATIPPAAGHFPFYWNKANHTVAHINSGTATLPAGFVRAMAIRLSGKGRPFESGDILSATWKARAIGAVETPNWDVWLAQDDRTVKSAVYSVDQALGSLDWTTFVCELQVNAGITAGKFFYIVFQETNLASDYHMDHFCVVRGRQGAMWEGTEEEENLAPENTASPVVGAGFTSTTAVDTGAGLGQDGVASYSGTTGGAITL